MIGKWIAAAGTCLMLVSCGGGHEAEGETVSRRSATPGIGTAPLAVSFEQALAAAEGTFAQLFTGSAQDGTYQQYTYRYYPATGNYIAIDTDKRLHVFGPVSNGLVQYVGHLLDYACLADAASCDSGRQLSPVQANWEMATLGSGYASFVWGGTATAPTSYFVVERTLSGSPRASGSSSAMNSVTAVYPFAGGPAVAAEFSNCTSSTAFSSFAIYLDDTGNLAKVCGKTAWQVQYVGDALYLWGIAENGRVGARHEITDVTFTDVSGQNIAEQMRTSVGSANTALKYVKANAAVFPEGATYGVVYSRPVADYIILRNHDSIISPEISALQPVSRSGSPGTIAQTIEQATPYFGAQFANGTLVTVNGRRVWRWGFAEPSALSYALVEIDGKVYFGQMMSATSTSSVFTRFYNTTARDAILNAQLDW